MFAAAVTLVGGGARSSALDPGMKFCGGSPAPSAWGAESLVRLRFTGSMFLCKFC